MKQLNEQQLQTHVPIVGWLLIAHSLLPMVMGLVAFTWQTRWSLSVGMLKDGIMHHA